MKIHEHKELLDAANEVAYAYYKRFSNPPHKKLYGPIDGEVERLKKAVEKCNGTALKSSPSKSSSKEDANK